jgi:hypothetical protein
MDISQSEIPLRRIRIPVSPLGFRLRTGPKPSVGAVPKMTNKPNLPHFWPKNADHPKKQTQSNPIARRTPAEPTNLGPAGVAGGTRLPFGPGREEFGLYSASEAYRMGRFRPIRTDRRQKNASFGLFGA